MFTQVFILARVLEPCAKQGQKGKQAIAKIKPWSPPPPSKTAARGHSPPKPEAPGVFCSSEFCQLKELAWEGDKADGKTRG